MFELKLEKVRDLWNCGGKELALEGHGDDANFDLKAMELLQKSGNLHFLAARKDGNLVGYLSWIMDFDVQRRGRLIIQQWDWYIRPAAETFGLAADMYKFLRGWADGHGVKEIHWRTKVGQNGIGRFLKKRGATEDFTAYRQVL